jgi:hypothetical protein
MCQAIPEHAVLARHIHQCWVNFIRNGHPDTHRRCLGRNGGPRPGIYGASTPATLARIPPSWLAPWYAAQIAI